jgi:VWFA-related protein
MSKWILVVWLSVARGVAQDAPASPLIKLNVVAVDARGQSVGDLKREEFEVFDNGKSQHIASFRRNDAKPLRAIPVAKDEVSNRSGTQLTRATVILFDLLNARMDDRAFAVNQMIPALHHVEDSGSVFLYILTMNGTLYPIHPLPGPEAVTERAAKPWTDDIKALLDDAAKKLFRLRPTNLTVDERVHMTYDALEALAAKLGESPGRKSLIWISHGMPISIGARSGATDEIDYTPLLQRLTATLDRANVAVYPVRQPGSLAPGASESLANGMGSTETLEQFAGLTGGRAFGTVDVAGAVTQAANDARLSYLIAFDPPLDKWDGKYHKLRVVCSRKGVRLQTKQGYYAFAGDAHDGDQEKAAIETAIASPFDLAEIGLYAKLTPDGKGARSMKLDFRIDAADVVLTPAGEAFKAQMVVAFSGFGADGRSETSAPGTFTPRLTVEQRERAMQEGLAMTRAVTLPGSIKKLRVIVYDRATGAIGSVTLPVVD